MNGRADDQQGPFHPRPGLLSRINPADIWVVATFVVILIGVAVAYNMYSAIESMNRMRFLNAQQILIWREVTRDIDFVLDETDTQLRSNVAYDSVQGKLAHLIDEGHRVASDFNAALTASHTSRHLFGLLGDVDDNQLRALSVDPELVRRAMEVRDAPHALLRTDFSFWPTEIAVAVQGERYIAPLTLRAEVLSQQTHSLIRAMYVEGGILLILLTGCIMIIWLLFLRRAVRRLAMTQSHLQLVLDNMPAYLCSFSPDGRFRSANRNYLKATGYRDQSGLKGRHLLDVLGQERWDRIQRHLAISNIEAGTQFEVETDFTGEDAVLLVSYDILRDKVGKPVEIFALLVDITPLSQARRELRLSEEHLRITLNSIGDAVITTDIAGCVVSMNPQAETLTGWSATEATGRPLPEIFNIVNAQTRNSVSNPVEAVLRDDANAGLANETLLIARDGSEHMIADSGAPIRSPEGETVGVVMVFRDVTQEYLMRDNLAQSEKLQAIGLLAGGIAHDFNNIMAGIQGNADLLSADISAPERPEASRRLSQIGDLVKRGAGLTSKLIQFAHARPRTDAPVNLADVVQDGVDLLKNTTQRGIVFEFSDNSRVNMVMGDESALQAAVMNVLLNATDAVADTGTISIRLGNLERGKISALSSDGDAAEPFVCLCIRDTGTGIPPETLHRVFEPFFTTKEVGKGVGLGLPATYGTVKNHGGEISIRSTLGTGTELCMFLPAFLGRPAPRPISRQPQRQHHATGLTILFADDEAALRETAVHFLTARNHQIIVAENGQECVDLFAQHRDRIDVIILDLNMPVKSGNDAIREILQIDPKARIIITSGYSPDTQSGVMESPQIVKFLRKPYAFRILAAELDANFASQQDKPKES
ncbi:PAS domain S-box protein [Paracoccus sp. (in: a-proteobacteria)]|uniref:hybrid sensor histidine kinase/response regulator n=1 Tax=Paracoccus sp. TaxID=267 RepID=UPI003A89D21D